MKEISIKFCPRPYQKVIMRKFLIDGVKRLLLIQHRRAGKDTLAWQLTWIKAMETVGLYYYLLPVISQSSSVIWRGRGKDGTSFIDYIPPELVKKVNQSTQSITLVNGSIIRVTGSDAWESLIGSNCIGVTYSEYQSSDERAWNLIRPILSENGGWAIFTATSRGYNHLWDLLCATKDNPEWYISLLTVDDTTLQDGVTPVISQSAIQSERASGMPENIIQQEYYLSFSASIQNSYYGDEVTLAREQGRIGEFSIEKDWPVHSSWDLGISDATSICLFQVCPRTGSIHVIYHFEQGGEQLAYYAYRLEQLKMELGFRRWGQHFFPHDIRVRELGSGLTRVEQLSKCGISPRIVGNHLVVERIQCVRAMMHKVKFLEKNCKTLLKSLSEYRARWDEKNQISSGPLHDKCSHAADSFGYFAVGFLEWQDPAKLKMQKTYASFTP